MKTINRVKKNNSSHFDSRVNDDFVKNYWRDEVLPTLMEFITIPNKSPMFDPLWEKHRYMDNAVTLVSNWCESQSIKNMTIDVVRMPQRTPLLFIEIAGDCADTILLYGHLDKQPEMTGWEEGLHPFKPIIRGDKLYGRGAADDGYAVFSAITAIKSLQTQNQPHARCVLIIECSEESGSSDLPFYMTHLKDRIGRPSLVIGLDSGCGNYEQLWITTSLRGLVGGVLSIDVMTEGVHSGLASGIVPSCNRILQTLLNRIEDQQTGDVLLPEATIEIPQERIAQAHDAAKVLGTHIFDEFPLLENIQPESTDLSELILRRTWKASLSLIGAAGLPPIESAGNVTLPGLAVKLSLRIPPTADADQVLAKMKHLLETQTPYHAHVRFEAHEAANGWHAPALKPWIAKSAEEISQTYFQKSAMYLGEGGSIPFMGMLGEQFPEAQFIITGVLGPHSNAHGPNEFLHLPMAHKLTASIAHFIHDHYHETRKVSS